MENSTYEYDVIIIGGGATGSGIALDSTLRGYKTLLLEKNDFASGTSSKSTKLIHGGVRYLEKAILTLNKSQLNLVTEGLKERYYFLNNAPHLSHKVTLFTPLYSFFQALYFRMGLLLYDFLSFLRNIGKSQFISKKTLLLQQPYINPTNLLGAVSYKDGAFNDTRMVIALLQSAQEKGATVKNYVEVKSFLYNNKKICGVQTYNHIEKAYAQYSAKVVINASGYAVDKIRKLDNKQCDDILQLSSGIHIVIDKKYLPSSKGILIPKTEDNRIIFMLPWQNSCLVGTTDNKATYTAQPKISNKEIDYLLNHLNKNFQLKLTSNDILSSFIGLRPLLKAKHSTSKLVREHKVFSSKSHLITIAGGKWTTYRKMAEETMDFIIKENLLPKKQPCQTKAYKVVGSQSKSSLKELMPFKIDDEVKKALLQRYGDQAINVAKLAQKKGLQNKFHKTFAFIEAEVDYAITYEYAKKPLDIILRRTALGFVNKKIAKQTLAAVTKMVSEKLHWQNDTTLIEYQKALKELNEIF